MSDFREDGTAALEWTARYLERVGELPVLAQVSPGEQAESFADVLHDLDELLLPALTNWQSPRFFSYFAVTSSEPAILAELIAAALNQVALVWRASPASTELELRVADWVRQLLGLPVGWHGHIEDTASTSTLAALIAARHVTGRNVVVCSEHAHSSVEKDARMLGMELRRVPVDDELRMRVGGYDLDDVACVVATVGTTSFASVDPVRELAERGARGRLLAPRRRGVCGLLVDLRGGAVVAGRRRARRQPGHQPAQVAARPDRLLAHLDGAAGRMARGVHPDARVPAHRRRGVLARRLRAGARPALPVAQAVGGTALLRGGRPAGDPARAHPPRTAVRRLGRGERGVEARRAAALLARRVSPAGLGRGERGATDTGQLLR
jgi:hypothetical protein